MGRNGSFFVLLFGLRFEGFRRAGLVSTGLELGRGSRWANSSGRGAGVCLPWIPIRIPGQESLSSIFRAFSEQFFETVSEQFQSSFRAFSEQFSEHFQSIFRAFSEHFKRIFRAFSEQIRAFLEQFQNSFRAFLEQFSEHFQSILGAIFRISEQFQSSFRAVSEHFQSNFSK